LALRFEGEAKKPLGGVGVFVQVEVGASGEVVEDGV